MGSLIDEVRDVHVQPGALRFWWLGQQSWIVKTATLTLFIDPYLTPKAKRNTPPFFPPQELTIADYILGTHDHTDHIDRPALGGMMAASPRARLIVPAKAAATLPGNGVPAERITALDGERRSVFSSGNLRVTALRAKHEFFDYSVDFGYPYLQYIIEADGVCIYTAGDTLLYDGMLTALQEWKPDVAFVPINGRDGPRYRRGCMGNMTWQEAADLCGEWGPGLVCPAHYEMFSDNSEDPTKFLDYCAAKYPALHIWTGSPGTGTLISARPVND